MDTSHDIFAGYLPEKEMAAELRHSVRTLARWRKLKIGPPHTENGRNIIYSIEGARTWLAAGGIRAAALTKRRTRGRT